MARLWRTSVHEWGLLNGVKAEGSHVRDGGPDNPPPEKLLALSQRAGRLWSWHVDVETMTGRFSRPIALFRKDQASAGPFSVSDVAALFGGDQAAELTERFENLRQTGESFTFEAVDRSGPSTRFFVLDAEAEFDEAGRVSGIFGVTRDVTSQRTAELAIAEQQALLEKSQIVGQMGHWRMPLHGQTQVWSSSLFAMCRMTPVDVLPSETFRNMIVPEQREQIFKLVEEAVLARRAFQYVCDIVLPDGEARTIETVAEPEYDHDGACKGFFGISRDITTLVNAERAVRDNEIRLQTIFDAMDRAGIGIGVQDSEGRVEIARPALLRIAGLRQETDVLGKRWSSLQGDGGPDIRGRFGDVLERAARGEMDSVPNLDVEWVRPDGHRLSVLVRLAPLPGGSRAMIVLDQTEQKVARREIEAREFRTRAILDAIDSAGIGYCVEDTDGRIFDVSPALRKMLGIPESEDLLGRKWTETLPLPDETIRQIQKENETYLAGNGEAFVYPEFVLSLPETGEMQLHARSTPLPGIGRLVLVIDQTERWRLEEQQAEMERHMQQVQKMEAVGQLAGGVAHEINNMLHPIRTFTRAAAKSDDAERRRQLLGRVIDCADKAARIVRETLHFARGDDSAATEHDLNALLSGVVGFSRDLPMRGVELEFSLPLDTMRAAVNETEFTQVIVNLLQNAADAMGDSGTILVELSPLEIGVGGKGALAPGRYAQISIEDTGEGMTPDLIDRAFEPFFTTKEPGKGTGLGLSVVYGIVKRWKGDIRIASERGKGTRVSIILPRIMSTTPEGTGTG